MDGVHGGNAKDSTRKPGKKASLEGV